MKRITRRKFARIGAAAVATPLIIPSRLLGAGAPSNLITVGFIGTGDHGTSWNLRRYLELKDMARVLVVCDVDGQRMRHAKDIVDEQYLNKDCAMTKDFREVIARKDIDAVMISTPDHWHTLISVMAARAGKDVQCEKPTLTIGEGKILIETIRKHERVFQTSTEDRSVPVYHRMAELVRNGRIGKLQRIEVILPKQPNVPGDPRRNRCRRTSITTCGSAPRRSRLTPRTGFFLISGGSGIIPAGSFATGARTCSTRRNGATTPSAAGRSRSKAPARFGMAASTTR
jgi:hypothetical protein